MLQDLSHIVVNSSVPVKKTPVNLRSNIFTNLTACKGSTIEEIAKTCKFDFTASKKPLNYVINGKSYEVPDKVAIHRDDDNYYLGTIGRERGVVQYIDSLRFTEAFVQEGDAQYMHAGISGHGRQAYVVMKGAEEFEIVPGDPIECFFYVQSSHDSTKSLMVIPCPQRKKTGGVFVHPRFKAIKIKHTKNVATRLILAKRSIHEIRTYFKEFKESFESLAKASLDKTGENGNIHKRYYLDLYLKAVFPAGKEDPTQAENRRNKIIDILDTDPSLKIPPCQNTLLGAYFATVNFVDNYLTVRNTKGRDERTAQIESKLAISGAGAKRKAEALAQAIKLNEKLGLV